MADTPTAPTIASVPLTTPVQFTEGMMGRTQRGATLSYDGAGTITLTRADGTVLFTKPVTEVGTVRRAEFGLYLRVDGKTVFVMLGNALAYMSTNVVIEAAGRPLGAVGSVAAGYGAVKASQHDNTVSGLEAWVELFRAQGVMGLDASPQAIWKNAWVWGAVVIAAVVVIAVVASVVG